MIESITLLYFDGCPSWQEAGENLRTVLEDLNLAVEIEFLRIDTVEKAEQEKFLGSPSIRVNDTDLWPEDRQHYALSCRFYQTPEGIKGVPSVDMISARLVEILSPMV